MGTTTTIDPTTGDVTAVSQEPLKATVTFSRKVNLGNYESADCSAFVQADIEFGDDEDVRAAKIKAAALLAKAAVYEQLGISFNLNDTAVAVESIERTFGQVETATEPPKAQPAARPAPRSNGALPWEGLDGKDAKAAAWEHLSANPKDWYDNRETATGSQPTFKHKASGFALWESYKGKSVVPDGINIPAASAF